MDLDNAIVSEEEIQPGSVTLTCMLHITHILGVEDIAAGNLKLILGMIWLLIRRYQIGAHHKLLHKKITLAWINAVLYPHLTVNNFNTDWTDGIALQ